MGPNRVGRLLAVWIRWKRTFMGKLQAAVSWAVWTASIIALKVRQAARSFPLLPRWTPLSGSLLTVWVMKAWRPESGTLKRTCLGPSTRRIQFCPACPALQRAPSPQAVFPVKPWRFRRIPLSKSNSWKTSTVKRPRPVIKSILLPMTMCTLGKPSSCQKAPEAMQQSKKWYSPASLAAMPALTSTFPLWLP